jgi:hypothetical protein
MSKEESIDGTNYSEYYDAMNIFYADKLKSSMKKKFTTCSGCKGVRQFIMNKDELIYTCGDTKGECGEQIKIKLASYLDYELMKREISFFKKRTPSLEIVKDLINVQKEIEQYDSFVDQTKELLKNTTKTYIRENDLKKRGKEIEKYQEEKIKILIEMNKLKPLMNEPNEPKQKEYKQKYIHLSQELNTLYKSMREITDIRMNCSIMTDEPHIKKSSDKYTEIPKTRKTKKEEK